MAISCGCSDLDCDWYYTPHKDYSQLETSKRKRCESCNDLINIGDTVLKFYKYRPPRDEIEDRIYGEEVDMAPFYFCEECADLFFSIKDYGYCISLGDESMQEMAKTVAAIEKEGRGGGNG